MVKAAHDFYFFDEAFLPFVFRVGCLLREGLHCKVTADFHFLCKVDRREVAFSDFLLGLELFVEAALVEPALECFPPCDEVGF